MWVTMSSVAFLSGHLYAIYESSPMDRRGRQTGKYQRGRKHVSLMYIRKACRWLSVCGYMLSSRHVSGWLSKLFGRLHRPYEERRKGSKSVTWKALIYVGRKKKESAALFQKAHVGVTSQQWKAGIYESSSCFGWNSNNRNWYIYVSVLSLSLWKKRKADDSEKLKHKLKEMKAYSERKKENMLYIWLALWRRKKEGRKHHEKERKKRRKKI